MKRYIPATIAALMVTGIAGIASAQDAVYSSPDALPMSPPSVEQSRGQDVDRMSTGSIMRYDSIYNNTGSGNADLDGSQDSGDYYDGALRPFG